MKGRTLPGVMWAVIASLLWVTGCASSGTVIIDPAEARDHPDFQVQGEYTGAAAGEILGLQVVSRGEGRFEALVYRGGLPGDGWDGEEPVALETRRENDRVRFDHQMLTAEFVEGNFVVRFADADADGAAVLEKAHRVSPHLGAKPPQGAVVLFDGTSLDAFRGRARMTEEGLLKEGATTRDRFEDMTLHLEFKLAFMRDREGQRRTNSGVYVQQRYEVQILDTFAQPPAIDGMASLYGERAPDLNMTYPPLSWQTFRIHFTAPRFDENGKKTANARFTVYHNGIRVHDDVELPHGTGAGRLRGEGGAGPIYFQRHGSGGIVRFQNIWLTTP